jgi:hypothetical protein
MIPISILSLILSITLGHIKKNTTHLKTKPGNTHKLKSSFLVCSKTLRPEGNQSEDSTEAGKRKAKREAEVPEARGFGLTKLEDIGRILTVCLSILIVVLDENGL